MSKTQLKLTFIALCLTFFNCKKETAEFTNYKYANEDSSFLCENLDSKLYLEALLSFEDDITTYYDFNGRDLRRSYSFYTRDALGNKAKYQDILTPHTMEVFEALKKDKDLWLNNSINYNSDLFTCLGDNFRIPSLQTTFKALVSTNSMRPELFGAPLLKHVKNSHEDRYIATYVAFDLFYAKIFDIDPTTITNDSQKTKASRASNLLNNKAQTIQESAVETEEKDPHAGHNH